MKPIDYFGSIELYDKIKKLSEDNDLFINFTEIGVSITGDNIDHYVSYSEIYGGNYNDSNYRIYEYIITFLRSKKLIKIKESLS